MSLPVVAVITAKPGSEDVVREALSELVAPTREEEGCLSYSLYQSSDDSTVFVTVESWRAAEDLEGHMKSAHIAATFAKAGDALAAPPAIHSLMPIDEQ
ncbi:putative quinol monooxygenase [Jatrophihabitans endophyticus]|uniref:putative quinol monooxygenase n=1 Tax=Jatrophihabitans endophyticus TaxID=1206085 RepID=UPI001A0654CC|nr:putative quinol monooxygenase [Jatrophihabitans endophyticus]MBE7189536.1 antibiotic biosynthesis monooxygenase [Jatrophihabitans endophyticus]